MSFPCKSNDLLWVFIGAVMSTVLTMWNLLATAASPNFVNIGFSQPNAKPSLQPIKVLLLQTANPEVGNVEGVKPLFIRVANLHVCTWFGIVKYFDLDILLRSQVLIDCYAGYSQVNEKSSIRIAGPW